MVKATVTVTVTADQAIDECIREDILIGEKNGIRVYNIK